ncbi:glycosyltransferase family 4 protein [Aureimonas fodinaquatilis]|uniref:Glycosyltransferase family 4 protein n=1 Tax=Aureimonas fodinaquatilis TaxID=2565783 RepID=A0A5B0DVS0_9HYPH|nr:glycosyltransferase family 4 protein [Aureimonas fodinaquatilis]KAA0970586.1 glycosyltransferase family 4 protein [Aureimonas fodinaquatilis]
MEVAYLINQYPKTSHSFIRREILALEKAGVRVHRTAMRGWDAELVDPEDIAEQKQTYYLLKGGAVPLVSATAKQLFRNPKKFWAAARQSLRMMRKSDRSPAVHAITLAEACLQAEHLAEVGAQHIHAHFGTNSAEVAMLTSMLSGIPYSFTVHGPDEFDAPRFMKLGDKVHHAKFVAAISDFCASQIYRWAEFADWGKIRIVRCGLDPAYVLEPSPAPIYPRRLVTVGRLGGQKGHWLLVQAAALLKQRGVDFELVLVGDGELRPDIEGLIAREGLGDTVTITGWASGDEVRHQILAARAMILTSFAEGLPVVIMEAYALGRPVLATEIAAIPELVREGETGWLFSAGSVEAAAAAMLRCLEAPDVACADMGRRGQALVRERHNLDQEAAYLASLFREQSISR